jgi:hypothetical protein
MSSAKLISVEEVYSLLRVTGTLAARVHSGEFYAANEWGEHAVLSLGDLRFDCETVAETIATGVMMLAAWTRSQGGPGALPWAAKLREWLDDFENDFGKSDDSDELQGYGRLVAILANLFTEISSSPSLQ